MTGVGPMLNVGPEVQTRPSNDGNNLSPHGCRNGSRDHVVDSMGSVAALSVGNPFGRHAAESRDLDVME